MNKVILHIILLILPFIALAQNNLVTNFNSLTDYTTTDAEKAGLSQRLTSTLIKELKANPSFASNSNIRQLKIVSSEDKKLSLYTWHYSLSDGYSQYGGILRYEDHFQALTHNDKAIKDDEKYTPNNWCGGIYYDIIDFSGRGSTNYLLLAWDGNNGVTSKKIIDVLSFDKKGRAIFGLPVFAHGRQSSYRVVMKYSSQNSLLLKYDKDEQAIITNALVPNDDRFNGIESYYSAGDNFNVYRYEKDQWVLYRNVDLRMNKADSKKLQQRNSTPVSGL